MPETTQCDKASSTRPDGAGAAPISMGVWLKAAWRRKWLMLLLLVLITGAGVLFTYLQNPVYEATAQLDFSERSPGAFRTEGGEKVTENYVNKQISLMTRDAALGEIARDPDLALSRAPMFQGETDLVEALKDRIRILPLKDTTILSVSVQGEDPKLVTAIANKVADFQRSSLDDSRDASTRNAVQEYVKKMADMSSEMNAIGQNIWSRANSAHISGLTFNEQQKDSRAIVAAFQDQTPRCSLSGPMPGSNSTKAPVNWPPPRPSSKRSAAPCCARPAPRRSRPPETKRRRNRQRKTP